MGISLTNDVVPRIKKILKIFDPTTFPTASSTFLRNAATILVTSSGILVPMATTVSPINKSLTPNA